jgi:hypothetical protein
MISRQSLLISQVITKKFKEDKEFRTRNIPNKKKLYNRRKEKCCYESN